MMVAFMKGSSTWSSLEALVNQLDCLPLRQFQDFGVSKIGNVRTVVIGHIEFRSKRSWIISMCNMPKNPQRKPNPKAAELSGKIQVKRRSIVVFHRVS
jgi:hypothetical protein